MAIAPDVPVSGLNPAPGYGIRIAKARLSVNKTRRDLAQAIDVTYGTVRRWELEELTPSDENLVRVARVTKLNAGWLLFGDTMP